MSDPMAALEDNLIHLQSEGDNKSEPISTGKITLILREEIKLPQFERRLRKKCASDSKKVLENEDCSSPLNSRCSGMRVPNRTEKDKKRHRKRRHGTLSSSCSIERRHPRRFKKCESSETDRYREKGDEQHEEDDSSQKRLGDERDDKKILEERQDESNESFFTVDPLRRMIERNEQILEEYSKKFTATAQQRLQ